eukprot:scaffold71064_cov37-Prasinocladus_malaysianus.AAC.1
MRNAGASQKDCPPRPRHLPHARSIFMHVSKHTFDDGHVDHVHQHHARPCAIDPWHNLSCWHDASLLALRRVI